MLVCTSNFFDTLSTGCTDDKEQLFSLLVNVERWKGSDEPDKVGMLRLKQAGTLEPMQEPRRPVQQENQKGPCGQKKTCRQIREYPIYI